MRDASRSVSVTGIWPPELLTGLSEAPAAIGYLQQGHPRGKIVITV